MPPLPRIARIDVSTPQGAAGLLGNERGSYLFGYRGDAQPEQSVSLIMPTRWMPYTSGALPPVFSMNLPEGFMLAEIRERLAKLVRIDPLLLLALTGDSHPIGRLRLHSDALESLLPDRADAPAGESLDEILRWDGAADLFHELLDRYVLRSGVSGVQPKVVVPERARADTAELIIKSGRDEFPHLAVNEYLCMSIAKAAGMPVPDFWLSDNHELFVMRRFDVDAAGQRLGFEDFAALTGRQPEQKYEGSYATVARAIHAFVSEEHRTAALAQLFDTVALSCIVGNGDAHLKNFGVLYTHPAMNDVRMAPVYDIVNTTLYLPKDSLALKLGTGKAFAGQARLAAFASDCGVREPDQRIERILQAVEQVMASSADLLDEASGLRDAFDRSRERFMA